MDAFFSLRLFYAPDNGQPDWVAAGQKIETMTQQSLDDVKEYFGNITFTAEQDAATGDVYAAMRNQLHMDLVDFRQAIEEAEVSGGELIVRKTMPDGQRFFVVAGFSTDDTPMHAYEWVTARLAESGIMHAAGFSFIS